MMVYIVFYTNFHGIDEYHGVYRTEEGAELAIKRFCDEEQTSFRIEAVEFED